MRNGAEVWAGFATLAAIAVVLAVAATIIAAANIDLPTF